MVRRSEQSMGAEALLAATGRTREQWRELLSHDGEPSRTSGTPVNLTWERLPDQDAAAAATARCETLLAAASGPAR